MKTIQKGFVAPLFLALIAILLIGGGTYAYVEKNKQGNQPVVSYNQATSTAQNTNSRIVDQCIHIKRSYDAGDIIKEICNDKRNQGMGGEFYIDHGKLWLVYAPYLKEEYKPAKKILIGEAVDTPTLLSELNIIHIGSPTVYYVFRKQVYFDNKVIADADPKSFVVIGEGEFKAGPDSINNQNLLYSKDAKHVYYRGILIPKADPATIKVIVNGAYFHEYAKDKTRVYYHSDEIVGADPASFKTFAEQAYEGPEYGPYGVDDTNVFYEAGLLPEADIGTFKMQQENYASDKSHVFLDGKVIPNADPKTFKYPELIYG